MTNTDGENENVEEKVFAFLGKFFEGGI